MTEKRWYEVSVRKAYPESISSGLNKLGVQPGEVVRIGDNLRNPAFAWFLVFTANEAPQKAFD